MIVTKKTLNVFFGHTQTTEVFKLRKQKHTSGETLELVFYLKRAHTAGHLLGLSEGAKQMAHVWSEEASEGPTRDILMLTNVRLVRCG